MGKILFIIAPENYRDEELFHTQEELETAGHETDVASSELRDCLGMLGGTIIPDIKIEHVDVTQYDAVVFVGGNGAKTYFDDKTAHNIARDMDSAGKLVCAICIAPSILANAGILKGKKATCWPSEQENIEAKGAVYTGEDVEIDDNIITANGPKSARKFGKTICEML